MASRKNTRATKLLKSKDYNTLALSDVLCPICRSILIEPVSLPCNHVFCLFCFEGTMENANLVCPLCRLRISSWLRKGKKDNTIINEELWKAVKERFSQHVKNKLNGVDENLEEKRDIIVSYPGEIRKEYELQKQKEDEEQSKIREAELKASEEFIDKLKKEEDYDKAVMEEKLKLDEEVAKKLEEELACKNPSTSKMKITYKKLGPMDKFVKKDIEKTPTSSLGSANSFVNKEYKCLVLCLDSRNNSTKSNVMSPKIQKKIQQIQKIVDLETASDGSDCIESEMRYFKPIDYRLNPPSQRKSPLKVTPKKLITDTTARVLSPAGLVNFSPNILESAFAKFSITMPKTQNAPKSPSPQSPHKKTCTLKRSLPSTVCSTTPDKKLKMDNQEVYKISLLGSNNTCPIVRKKLFAKTVEIEEKGVDTKSKGRKPIRKNGSLIKEDVAIKNLKAEQEQADLEFAMKLQEEINRGHFTRSSRSLGVARKQKKIDEMIKSPYRVK